MPTGKIKWFNSGKGYGFIANDAGGQDAFLHVSNFKGDQTALVAGASVAYSIKQTGKGPAAVNVSLREASSRPIHRSSPTPPPETTDPHFHNPYTFVPSPRRDAIKNATFAGDYDPLKCGLGHASLDTNLWTGYLPIKLTTITPLLMLDAGDKNKHETYDMLDRLPESSLRGMLRSAYEVVTNSRYGCFRNDDRLAYRMDPREALKLVPAIIENGSKPGELEARLCPGTSLPTENGPNRKRGAQPEEGAMYAAMLTLYGNSTTNTKLHKGYDPKSGDEVWVEIVLCQHEVSPERRTDWPVDRVYLFWKVVKIWPTRKCSDKPTPTNARVWHLNKPTACLDKTQSYYAPYEPHDSDTSTPIVHVLKGRVLITNENMGNKHDERVFITDLPTQRSAFPIKNEVKEAWRMRIRSYREAHSESEIFGRSTGRPSTVVKPWKKIGSKPGETAWSPHLYQDGQHGDHWGRNVPDAIELRAGDMVYVRCEFGKGVIKCIKDLFPVMISRELYDVSPATLLDDSLRPAAEMDKLSPADRLFGWAPPRGARDGEGGYKGRIRIVCEDGPRPMSIEKFSSSLPLAILGKPKPSQGGFYVGKDKNGSPQDRVDKKAAGYDNPKVKSLRGRKHYWHHKGMEAANAPGYWSSCTEDRTQYKTDGRYQEYRRPKSEKERDSQNRSITGWIKPGQVFNASLHLQNLQPEEVGALLWLMSLPNDHYFKLGYGKPLGFGSVRLEIDDDRRVERCLPLGTGKDWRNYYKVFGAPSPATMGRDQEVSCISKFKSAMLHAYGELLDRGSSTVHEDGQTADSGQYSSSAEIEPQVGTAEYGSNTSSLFEDLPFIKGFLKTLTGPHNGAPVHYPRVCPKPDPKGENFEWFQRNESQGRGRRGKRLALPDVVDGDGLPYDPVD